ncbi:hypothetical protein F2P81_002632 [Scophthalmus maximus]|uniref:Uncharacterized protein n=1 Tax=Scophthalmus maximus TaxID=52904 RepID=A0A6A4TJA8_SCOMX|nr:hypothetical protein F2P81_002632 [Scophthalmus maximus]
MAHLMTCVLQRLQYRVLSKSENCKKAIQLGNDCGFVTKRTRTQPAVVRYARFSEDKYPEAFCQSILQLFLPYRVDEQLRPPSFEKFQQFYENGHVRLSDGSMHSVKDVVDVNRVLFEIEADELDKIQDIIDSEGLFEDAWCELCPEKELERLECAEELKDRQLVEEQEVNPPAQTHNSNQRLMHWALLAQGYRGADNIVADALSRGELG